MNQQEAAAKKREENLDFLTSNLFPDNRVLSVYPHFLKVLKKGSPAGLGITLQAYKQAAGLDDAIPCLNDAALIINLLQKATPDLLGLSIAEFIGLQELVEEFSQTWKNEVGPFQEKLNEKYRRLVEGEGMKKEKTKKVKLTT